MGVMPTSRHHEVAEQPHALRFAAYERATAPGASSQGSPTHQAYSAGSPSGSPVKGQFSLQTHLHGLISCCALDIYVCAGNQWAALRC